MSVAGVAGAGVAGAGMSGVGVPVALAAGARVSEAWVVAWGVCLFVVCCKCIDSTAESMNSYA